MRRSVLITWVVLIGILLAPLLATNDPMRGDATQALQPPSRTHWLGVDQFGRDVWTRLLYGGQHTLTIAALATSIAALLGTLIGLVAGADRSWISAVLLTLLNAIQAFPSLLLGLIILTVLGQGSLPLIIATSLPQIAPFALVARAAVLAVRSAEYIEAAAALGARQRRILLRYILPNIQPTLLAYTSVVFGYSIINSAGLYFLGLGGELGIPDWGVMLAEGRGVFRAAPWLALAPGVAITLVVLLVNRAADQLAARKR